MKQLSAIHHIYAYEDGDNITPRMGVHFDTDGIGLTQYWDTTKGCVVNTDFAKDGCSPTLYPMPYSSKLGRYVLPSTEGQQWYYNNLGNANAGILDENGDVKEAFADLFQKTTISITIDSYTTMVFPALKIIGNLATAEDHTDKYIYYSSTYNGKAFTCQQLIPIQTTVGDVYDLLIQVEGESGSGDDVLSNDNDWVRLTPMLQSTGATIDGLTYTWQRNTSTGWVNVTHEAGVLELSGNSLKVYNAGVDGQELFRVVTTHGGAEYAKVKEITDVHDPYYIVDGCTLAGDTIRSGETAMFTPKIYDRATGAVDTANAWSYYFSATQRETGDTVISETEGTTFSVTYDQVVANSGVIVRIEARR